MRIIGPVTNALQPSATARFVSSDDFVNVETIRHEHELRWLPARDQARDGGGGCGEARSRTNARVGRRRRTVHRNLHALDGERREPVGCGIVDAAAIGLELEGDAAVGENLEEVPAMRDTERLAAAEGRVRNAGFDDASREVQRFVAPELIGPRVVRAPIPRSR